MYKHLLYRYLCMYVNTVFVHITTQLLSKIHYHVQLHCIVVLTASRVSCDGCIDATVCRDTTGSYLFQFSKLFDQSNTPCELKFPNGTLVSDVTLMEGKCVKLPPNSNYSMLCPICPGDLYTIYYTVLTSNIKDCPYGKHYIILRKVCTVCSYVCTYLHYVNAININHSIK